MSKTPAACSHLSRIPPSRTPKDLSLHPGIRCVLSQDFFSVISTFSNAFSAFIRAIDLAVWTLLFNKNLPQPEWMSWGKLFGLYLPLCSQLLYMQRNWLVWKLQDQVPPYLRCQESSLFFLSKQNEQKTSIQHKALPNADVNVLPQNNNVNVAVVCLFIAKWKFLFSPLWNRGVPSLVEYGIWRYNVSTSCKMTDW